MADMQHDRAEAKRVVLRRKALRRSLREKGGSNVDDLDVVAGIEMLIAIESDICLREDPSQGVQELGLGLLPASNSGPRPHSGAWTPIL